MLLSFYQQKINMSKYLLTGITGQAGTVFTQELLKEGHTVIGLYRRTANDNMGRLREAGLLTNDNVILAEGDVTDYSSIDRAIKEFRPDFIGNLAASSHVHESFKNPLANLKITGEGCVNVLESVRNNYSDTYRPKVWQMSSSEMFGSNYSVNDLDQKYQDENTPLSANSPYAAAKIYAHNMCLLYAKAYGMFVNTMVCFNFEGPYRGSNFVTKKITEYVASLHKEICLGGDKNNFRKLKLGNLNAMRDWTSAIDMVRGVLLCLRQDAPDTYCVCSNQIHSIKELCSIAFGRIGIKNWEKHVEVDPQFIRPVEVPFLRGSNYKIGSLGWSPKVSFTDLIWSMVDQDIRRGKI